jgi:hypothetical protein
MMRLAKPVSTGSTRKKRDLRRDRFMAILSILIIPRKYERILRSISGQVTAVALSVVGFNPRKQSETELVRKLANHGLTVAVANDMWQFCVNFARAEVQDPYSSYDRERLADLINWAESQDALQNGEPPRLRPEIEDRFVPT